MTALKLFLILEIALVFFCDTHTGAWTRDFEIRYAPYPNQDSLRKAQFDTVEKYIHAKHKRK